MELLPDGILRVVYTGHVTTPMAAGVVHGLRDVLGRGGVRAVVFDCDRLTSFDKDSGRVGSEVLQTVRGVGVIVVSIPSTAVRMMAMSIAFAVGIPFKVATSWKDAHARATDALAHWRT
jgi:hypothetical protein